MKLKLNTKFNVMKAIKLVFGFYFFMLSGGAAFVALGLMPAAALLALTPLLPLSPELVAVLGISLLIALPIALYFGTWFEEGFEYYLGFSLNLRKYVRAGIAAVPVVGQPIAKTIK